MTVRRSVSFQRDLKRFVDKVYLRDAQLWRRVDAHVGRSIRTGSPVTGAPGQPVKTGALLRSWKHASDEVRRFTMWYTRSPYGPIIEYNLRGALLRSKVGGFHSVTMTRANFERIVAYELEQVKAEVP